MSTDYPENCTCEEDDENWYTEDQDSLDDDEVQESLDTMPHIDVVGNVSLHYYFDTLSLVDDEDDNDNDDINDEDDNDIGDINEEYDDIDYYRGVSVEFLDLMYLSNILNMQRYSEATVATWSQAFADNDDTEAFDQSFNSQPLRFVPASDSSIEGLKKVRVEGVLEQCTVCLEDILVGTEATRMPCTHAYHGDCIKKWLVISNLCPLCRFSMPCG